MEKEEIFACPECEKQYKRDNLYKKIVEQQNMIALMMGDGPIKDMCMSCNYIEK